MATCGAAKVPGAIALVSRGGETHVQQAGDVQPDRHR